jgi:outer membrane protein OmpA-like peptidoglycan-associated protein
MRHLLLVAALAGAQAHAMDLDPRIEVGAHAGVLVIDDLDLINTSYIVKPRLGVWFSHTIGLELDMGISTGRADATDHGFLLLAPELNMVGNPVPESKKAPLQPILTIGVGLAHKSVDGDGVRGESYAHTRNEAIASVGTGFIIPIWGPLRARTDLRMKTMLGREDERYISPYIDFEWTAGLSAMFSVAKDQDKDGMPDKKDYCPTEAEDFDAWEDEDGCPELDNDLDKIEDGLDKCPNEAEDEDKWEDDDGCPDPDNDGDSILDDTDQCVNAAGPETTGGCPDADGDDIADKDDGCPQLAGLIDFQGCPDTDADGLADPDDECPKDAGGADAFGCPDGDADRVPDYRDECPTKPVAKGVDPMRSNGCPARVYVTADQIVITEKVYFDTGKSTIQRTSFGLLDDVAATLVKYPEILKVVVGGHTDDRGNDDANMKLSQDRAQAVLTYLVSKGVDATRLEAKGFGETVPVEPNTTAAGREMNRRVEFRITEQRSRKVEVTPEPAAPAEQTPAE